MQCIQQLANRCVVVQGKGEVAAQVSQMPSPRRAGTFLLIVVRKLLQRLCNVGRHIALFLDVLVAPRHRVGVWHGTCQSHRMPLVTFA